MRANTDWFMQAQWGVFTHFLTGDNVTPAQWNKTVDAFDVKGLAQQLKAVGARYYFITLGQNSGHYCAPNATYDRLVGIKPSKCSRRDLVADLYDALHPLGITLMVYLPSGAPDRDKVAMERLEWRAGNYRLAEFQVKWEAVVREWSRRWGKKVAGWWFDGCYYADAMYRHAEPPNFQTLAAAAKAGNPDSLVAFNPGVLVPVVRHSEFEDYTAGEINDADQVPLPRRRRLAGAQWHMLSYLGTWWCGGDRPRYTDPQIISITKQINAVGGVVTWDVPIGPTGRIPEAFAAQLAALGRATR